MLNRKQEKLRSIDRVTGYMILILLFSTLFSFTLYGLYIVLKPHQIRYATIDQISNLGKSDPVKFKGLDVGRIEKITKIDNDIIIKIGITTPFNLYGGYTVTTGDVGIMGDRALIIKQGFDKNNLVTKQDTLKAFFTPGISEMLGNFYKIPDLIAKYREKARLVINGNEDKVSLIKTFNILTTQLDTITDYFFRMATTINSQQKFSIDSINTILVNTTNKVSKIDSIGQKKLSNIYQKIGNVIEFTELLDSSVTSLQNTVTKISDSRVIQKDDLTKIMYKLSSITNTLNDIRNASLKARGVLKLGFPNNQPVEK